LPALNSVRSTPTRNVARLTVQPTDKCGDRQIHAQGFVDQLSQIAKQLGLPARQQLCALRRPANHGGRTT